MLVWLASYPRSGNHLLRVILRRSFNLGSYTVYQYTDSREAELPAAEAIGRLRFSEPTAEAFIKRARRSAELVLAKTHERVPVTDRAIYVVRDARAAFASYQRYIRRRTGRQVSLQRLIKGQEWPGAWSDHVAHFRAREPANTLLLRYEDLASARPPLEQIAKFLDVPVLRPFDVTFETLRGLDPKMFDVGSNGAGIKTIEKAASRLFWRHCGPTMQALGYGSPPAPKRGWLAQVRERVGYG